MVISKLTNLSLPSFVMPIIAASLREMAPERAIGKTFFEDWNVTTPVERALFIGKCALPLYKSFSKNYFSIPSFIFSTKVPKENFSKFGLLKFGTHPTPSEINYNISLSLKSWLKKTKGTAAVFVSGGASSLLFLPPRKTILSEVIKVENELLLKGAPIKEINIVRMALSELRGGGVAALLRPNRFFGFVWCDVEPKDYLFVGSAPLGGVDIDIKREAERVLKKWAVTVNFEIPEKKMDLIPDGSSVFKIADGFQFCKNIEKKLKEKRIKCKTIKIKEGTSSIKAAEIILTESKKIGKPAVLLGNGEFLVNVSKNGKGGRCSHLAANVAKVFYRKKKWFFCALATDGVDGNGDGGAFIHSEAGIKLDDIEKALDSFDTATFFREHKMFFKRKPSGNNLRDFWALILE